MSPSVRLAVFPVLPAAGGCQDPLGGKGVVGNGSYACAVRRAGRLEEGRPGLRSSGWGGTGRGKAVETVTTWSSMTSRVLALREHLAAEQVTCVVMEATSDFWKPFYYLIEDLLGGRGDLGQRPACEESARS